MIRYLRHDQIDKTLWDEAIRRSVNGIVYAYSWFLDTVCPGWDALVTEEYQSVFPLTHNSKFWIKYLYQPYFTQQLGVFSRNHLTDALVHEFLEAIPAKYRLTEISLNSLNKVDPELYPGKMRINLELDLILPYDQIADKYSQNARRNLKKADMNHLRLIRKPDPDELITLFRENYGRKEENLKFRHYEILRSLMIHALHNNLGMTIGAGLPGKGMSAGVFFLFDKTRRIFHFAASSKEGRDAGSMTMLIDSFIRENAQQPLILDFEGSDDENVARFYKGFGAREVPYYMVKINRLPGIVRAGLNLIKRG